MSETHKITKAAITIGPELAQPSSGFFQGYGHRQLLWDRMSADAFFVAFRIPNLWRRLVGKDL